MADLPKFRLDLLMTAPVRDRLEAVRAMTGSPSVVDVIAHALALYDTLLDATTMGRTVTISADTLSTLGKMKQGGLSTWTKR